MKIVKFFLSHLSKKTKPNQQNPDSEKRDFADLWSDLDDKGKETLIKEINQISRVRNLNNNPKKN